MASVFQFWENDLSFGEAEIFSICSKPPEKASAEFDHGYADKILLNSQVLNRLFINNRGIHFHTDLRVLRRFTKDEF